jgi:ABC-type transport system involved in multi-copper enzyme maturation permease subunit
MSLALRQTAAIVLDGYRELNARKLFWITMALSVIVVLAFAAIGLNQRGFTILWWTIDNNVMNSRVIEPKLLYKFAFANFAIPIWLAWGATILGLISTAGMVPEFVQGGAIELAVSKPIGRARLILTKYLSGLLFVALQVAVFTLAAFIVIGVRGESWEPRLFLAIPIMIVFFSYLYCVCALLGLITRSTIAALLLTILFWIVIFGVNTTETVFLSLRENTALRIEGLEARIESLKAQQAKQQEMIENASQPDDEGPPDLRAAGAALAVQKTNSDLTRRTEQLEQARKNLKSNALGHRISFAAKTLLPKTSETVKLLDRYLLTPAELDQFRNVRDGHGDFPVNEDDVRINPRALEKRLETALRSRTVSWVVGTSLAFEGVVLLLMLWIFRRRDF